MCVHTDDSARTVPPSLTTKPSNAAVLNRSAVPGGTSSTRATSVQNPSPATSGSSPSSPPARRCAWLPSDAPMTPAAMPAAAPSPACRSCLRDSRQGADPAGSACSRTGGGWRMEAMPESASRMRRRSCSMKAGSGVPPVADGPVAASSAAMRAISASSRSPTASGEGRPSPSSASRYPSKRSAASVAGRSSRSSSAIGPISEERGTPKRAVLEHARISTGDAHGLRGLGHAHALQESKLEHAAVVLRQAPQERLGADGGSLAGLHGRTTALVHRLPPGRHVIHADQRKPIEGTPVIGGGIVRDAVQPGRDLPGLPGCVELLDRADEDLGGEIFRIGLVSDARVDEPIDADDVLVVDLLEGTRTGAHLTDAVRPRLRARPQRGDQGGDFLEESRVGLVERVEVGSVDVDLADHLAALEDRHHDLATSAREAGEIAGIGVDVRDDLGGPRRRGRAAYPGADRNAGVLGGLRTHPWTEDEVGAVHPVDADPEIGRAHV